MNRKEYYSIGEVASICNISIRTLRYYDEIKLVVPEVRKSGSKYRYYSKEQMVNVFIVRKLRYLGIGLKEIKEIISKNEVEMLKKSIEERLTEIRKEIEDLEQRCQEGEDFLERLKGGSEILQIYDEADAYAENGAENIKIEEVPEITMYYCRKSMKSYHNEEVSLERWVEINEVVSKLGLRACGSVIVTYHTELFDQFLSKTCDVEFGIQVEEQNSSKTREFGGFEAATAYHVGPYRDIVKTYVKVLQWINQNDYKVSGPVSEEFIISPVDVANENEHVTKIMVPVVKGK
ncbi:MAG: MerR family transcriptional regulator [Clostridiales bacterium]|nr:MerR family transcriptional regulator [Clostridiales bacterium]